MNFGECSGVNVDKNDNVWVFNRGATTDDRFRAAGHPGVVNTTALRRSYPRQLGLGPCHNLVQRLLNRDLHLRPGNPGRAHREAR